jgi:uroporphyrinogen-III synthase
MSELLPLAGKRIVVTRSRAQAGELVKRIQQAGGEAVICPVIRFILPSDTTILDHALRQLSSFDWLVFTSVNGVEFFFRRLQQLGVEVAQFTGQVAAVGTKTAAALSTHGLYVQHIPGNFTAEHLLETMKTIVKPGQRILLPRANIGREVLPEGLKALGLEVTDAPAYDTVRAEENLVELKKQLQQKQIDMITFTSPSTVRYFLVGFTEAERREYLQDVHIAVIGPVTAKAVRDAGLTVHVMGEEYSIDGLLQAMSNYTGW